MAKKMVLLFSAGAIKRRLNALIEQGGNIMARVDELIALQTAKNEEILTAIAAERAENQQIAVDHRAQIQALQDQIAAGDFVTADQMNALATSADGIVAAVRQISEPIEPAQAG